MGVYVNMEEMVRKADTVHRYIAKFIDFIVLVAFATVLPPLLGFLTGLTYLLIADGFNGRSAGKRLIGLTVMETVMSGERPCRFKGSLIRNSPLAAAYILSSIPVLNILLIPTAVLLIVGAEAYFLWTDERGMRLGDVFASTRVVEPDGSV